MTEEVFGYLVYSTILFAVITLLWSERNFIKKSLHRKTKKTVTSVSTNEYDIIMKKEILSYTHIIVFGQTLNKVLYL
jgi:hypothetical protein